MKIFKICHIGCGGMSVRGHGPALKKYVGEYAGTVLAGCSDLEARKAGEFQKAFGFEASYTDWESMLEEIKPDAVSLAVPVKFTADMTVKIVSMGYNLLTEKPPGMTAKECTGIINAVKQSGVRAAAAFNRRYMPIVKQFMRKLSGSTAEHIRYDFFRNGRKDPDFSTTAIHGIDTVKLITGSPYSDIKITYQPLDGTPVGNIFINGKTKSGTTVSINFYPNSGLTAERAMVITGCNTYFLKMPIWNCFDYPGSILHYQNGDLIDEIKGVNDEMFITSGFYDEHRDFYESVRNSAPVSHEISDSLQSVEIMELIRRRETAYRTDADLSYI